MGGWNLPDDCTDEMIDRAAGGYDESEPEESDYDEYDLEPYCYRCDGTGWIHTCIDDLCQEECIHGDGDKLCPDCGGRNAF